MKCQILFSGKNKKKNMTNLSSAELAQRVVKVKVDFGDLANFFYKGDNFCDSVCFWHNNLLLKMGTLYKERICSIWEQIFPYR